MNASAKKLLAGALLAGMGIVTGEATLIATAGAVGANWLSEGLAGVWGALRGRSAEAPLTRAYANALRQAVRSLEEEYRRTRDPRADSATFSLVAACADSVAGAEFPPDVTDADSAQRMLDGALAALLHGHDEAQVAFLRERLLPGSAAAFQQQLVRDEAAWRAFHGLVLQGMAANSAVLLNRLDRFAETLAAWSNTENALAQLQRIETQLAQLAQRPTAVSRPLFDNRGMRVGRNVYQAAGNQYINSAHTEPGGIAAVTNIIGSPAGSIGVTPSSPASAAVPILFLAANPPDTHRLRLDQEARRIDEALRRGRFGERFQLDQHWAVRSEDLLDALLRRRPDIVHFSGHGDASGRLYLEDVTGRKAPIAPAAMAALLSVPGSVRCAVLNACWSDALAEALLAMVACVVGMEQAVRDDTAIAFAAGFYRALADGESVARAVAAGKAEAAAVAGEAPPVRLQTAVGVEADRTHFAAVS